MSEPTAAAYLQCRNLSWTLCPSGLLNAEEGFAADERRFWLRFEPLAIEWLREGVASGAIDRPTESWCGVSSVLAALYEFGDDEDGWLEVTGHQILFECLGHGGLMEGWSARHVVFGMESFLESLRASKDLREDAAAHLLAELGAWRQRSVDFLNGDGPWCRADTPPVAVSRYFL